MLDVNKSNWILWIKKAKEKKLTDTLRVTLSLFKQGKSIEEISKKREVNKESIEKQIHELIAKSFIDVYDILDKKRYDYILSKITNNNIAILADIKEDLNEDYSYFEIKCVLSDLAKKP